MNVHPVLLQAWTLNKGGRSVDAGPQGPRIRCEAGGPTEEIMTAVSALPDLLVALDGLLPYAKHAAPFFKYQGPGHEFYPNREGIEGRIDEACEALRKAGWS